MALLKRALAAHIIINMKKILLPLSIILTLSCKKNVSSNADLFVYKYCECLKANKVNEDYFNARVFCDSKFALENSYFRIGTIQALYGPNAVEKYPKSLLDSVHAFNREVRRRMESECPLVISPDTSKIVY